MTRHIWTILEIWGLLYQPPLPIMAKADPNVHWRAKFHLDWFILSPLSGENHQILPHFQLQHPVVAPLSNVKTKLNVGVQLQTFNCPTIWA